MNTKIIREDIQTRLSYIDLMVAFENRLGVYDLNVKKKLVAEQATWPNVQTAINKMSGSNDLILFAKINQGELISLAGEVRNCTLYIIGNPLIAEKILHIDIRASMYVPFRVCLYEEPSSHNTFIGFDKPSSFLGIFDNEELHKIGLDLDAKLYKIVKDLL